MPTLRLSPDLALPVDAVTETFAILAKRGAGKTYTASVFVEELAGAGMQVVVVDPIGVWWGLRSSADGREAGLPIVVLGGDHGDVPLEVTGGALVADLVTDEGLSVVLDLGRFRKGEQVRFMTDFAERLYHRNRNPLHLVLDEADAFAPQKPRPEGARLLGAIEDLVRRGRARGIGVTLVTQRSAVLNKDVLTQAEVLVALRTTHPRDRDAIEEWARAHGTQEQLEELRSTLAGLPVGEAWFWSPGWLDVFKRVRIRERRTFDSSATPKPGEKQRQPKTVADVDLQALEQRMQATIEKAKADDPRELRRRITELERELAHRPSETVTETVVERVEVPAVSDEQIARLEEVAGDLWALSQNTEQHARWLDEASHEIRTALVRAKDSAAEGRTSATRAVGKDAGSTPARQPAARTRPRHPESPGPEAPPPARPGSMNGTVTAPQQRILNALASLATIGADPADRTQLALFAETSPKSSGYANNLGALRNRLGMIDYPGPSLVTLTDEGRALADAGGAPSTVDELQEYVFRLVGPSRSRILQALIDAYPGPVEREELAELAGTSASSSGYANNLGSLRSLKLIDYPARGQVVALPVLFLE